ncbi:ribose 5-phosphate isomerase B [Candidatus Sumerlaeota bacterium]|nr:ribose 5-phosphate isomerase B [Candidatus Sumerlaeota bacterium]
MKIALGNDHRGSIMRPMVIERLKKLGHEVVDFGTDTETSVDYPDYAAKVARAVSTRQADMGILICGTGIGMSMAANKIAGVRAAVCTDEWGAKMARLHNNANVLALRGTNQNPQTNLAIVEVFLKTEFEGGRHLRRINKIHSLERR